MDTSVEVQWFDAQNGLILLRKNCKLMLVEDTQLCLSIILKRNKIYTSSNTTIFCFINLNNGD